MTHETPQLVLIRWQDAEADTGWDVRTDSDIEEPVIVESVGWLIAENKHTLLLAADVGTNEDTEKSVNRPCSIPRCCVKSIHRLKEGTKVKS